jgi:prophage antirepressor-like protein
MGRSAPDALAIQTEPASLTNHKLRINMNATAQSTNVVPFQFHTATIRTVMVDDVPMFVAKDVADALGYSNNRDAVIKYCKHASTVAIHDGSQYRHNTVIPERDVYRLVMHSKLPAAEAFEEWVVSEVLPSIRKTGAYVKGQAPVANTSSIDLLTQQAQLFMGLVAALGEQQSRVDALEQQVQELTVYTTIAGFEKQHKVRLTHSQRTVLGKRSSETARERGITLRVNGYGFYKQSEYPLNLIEEMARMMGVLVP